MQQEFTFNHPIFSQSVTPFIKWPGGKSGEFEKIVKAAPDDFSRFVEPFLGGGAMLLSLNPSKPAAANDIIPELIDLYSGAIDTSGKLKQELFQIAHVWEAFSSLATVFSSYSEKFRRMDFGWEPALSAPALSVVEGGLPRLSSLYEVVLHRDLPKKLSRIWSVQSKAQATISDQDLLDNVEGAFRAAFYMAVRASYNFKRVSGEFNVERTAEFFFLREYCYAAMFRFNGADEFNVPYGGASYNRKSFIKKVESLFGVPMQRRLANTEFKNQDFYEFMNGVNLAPDDFIFVDPPYDSEFSDYDNRSFSSSDQGRLSEYLSSVASKVMVVIGDTPLIRDLYPESSWNWQRDAMTYKWNVKSRNDGRTHHLTLTNY